VQRAKVREKPSRLSLILNWVIPKSLKMVFAAFLALTLSIELCRA